MNLNQAPTERRVHADRCQARRLGTSWIPSRVMDATEVRTSLPPSMCSRPIFPEAYVMKRSAGPLLRTTPGVHTAVYTMSERMPWRRSP